MSTYNEVQEISKITTYDEIYTCFMENGKVEESVLPQTQERIYELIKNAMMIFNLKMATSYKCDSVTETINALLSDSELLILAYVIRQVVLENEYSYFVSIWSPFQKEIGIANYKSQENAKKQVVEFAKKRVNELITLYEDANIMS